MNAGQPYPVLEVGKQTSHNVMTHIPIQNNMERVPAPDLLQICQHHQFPLPTKPNDFDSPTGINGRSVQTSNYIGERFETQIADASGLSGQNMKANPAPNLPSSTLSPFNLDVDSYTYVNKPRDHTNLGSSLPLPCFKVDPVLQKLNTEGNRKRKRTANRNLWKNNIRKVKCARGEAYIDTNGNFRPARAPRPVFCESKCRLKCTENFTEEERVSLCTEYWQLCDYCRQKDFLLNNTKMFDIQRKRTRGERLRNREYTLQYYFRKNNVETRVCKSFFLRTLDISQGPLQKALQERAAGGTFKGSDKRGRHTPANKTSESDLQTVRNHIESFLQINSTHTRKEIQSKFLERNLSVRKMHSHYKTQCENVSPPLAPVGEMTYRRVFCNEYNFSFLNRKNSRNTKDTDKSQKRNVISVTDKKSKRLDAVSAS